MSEILNKSELFDPVFNWRNKLLRVIWNLFWLIGFRYSPVPLFRYRCYILRIFGAEVESSARIYPSVRVWLPSHLKINSGATLGPNVTLYNQGKITVGVNAIVSQGAHLCASTHDYNDQLHPLVLAPIVLGDNVWVCSEAFIGPDVTVAEGGVIGARAVVSKSTEAWCVYAGNPAIKVNKRKRFRDV